ncbi:hypothetical protein BDV96DRAFT_694745 [Lophiotrema nucula]|uniref:Uncharacterized protein n=1 Tax=Lophiotrema nucula TaxID=690887 RepID=A0A6A5YFD0_9PLEO|nr:hypothetical protein BDV96DRAFT_694745 [Lophiotrema nucula]
MADLTPPTQSLCDVILRPRAAIVHSITESHHYHQTIALIETSKYDDWQILFLLEGGVTLFFAVLTFFVLPKKLLAAWILNAAEREHAVRRIQRDLSDSDEAAGSDYIDDDGKIHMTNVIEAFKDWRKLLIILFNICATTPVYGFTIFLLLIMKGMGYSGVNANLMSVSPFVVAAVGLYLIV